MILCNQVVILSVWLSSYEKLKELMDIITSNKDGFEITIKPKQLYLDVNVKTEHILKIQNNYQKIQQELSRFEWNEYKTICERFLLENHNHFALKALQHAKSILKNIQKYEPDYKDFKKRSEYLRTIEDPFENSMTIIQDCI